MADGGNADIGIFQLQRELDEMERTGDDAGAAMLRKDIEDRLRERCGDSGSGPSVYNGNGSAGAGNRAAALALALVSLDQIEPNLNQPYLIKGWLDLGSSSVLYGESNVGKTFLALDIALHVAAGLRWHGIRVAAACPVVYVASEGGLGVKNRLEVVRRDKPDLARGAAGRFHLLPVTLDLCAKADAPAVIEVLRGLPELPGLIIIDTLARSMGAGDENTGQDMGAFIAAVDRIRAATGAHVMVIHHSGKDTSRGARGHSSLRAAVDTEIGLTREGQTITAEAHKQRDGVSGKTFSYTLRSVYLGDDQDGDPITSCVVEPAEAPGKKPERLTGQGLIAMQAFGDALAEHGLIRTGADFPSNRQSVSLDHWRVACDRHSLTDGESEGAARQAFGRAWKGLQEKGLIRVIDGFAWRCADV